MRLEINYIYLRWSYAFWLQIVQSKLLTSWIGFSLSREEKFYIKISLECHKCYWIIHSQFAVYIECIHVIINVSLFSMQIEMMSEAIDETLDKDEAEEETEELTNQVKFWYTGSFSFYWSVPISFSN